MLVSSNQEVILFKSSIFIGAVATLFAAAAPSYAVTVTSALGPTDPGSPGEMLLVDFNTNTLPDGYMLTGAYSYGMGTVKNDHAAPAGDATRYLYVSSAIPNGSATLTTFDLNTLSFYWGSIDNYNSVDLLLSGGGTFHFDGISLPPADGNQQAAVSNRRVFFTADAGQTIQGITFNSSGIAFEVDDVYGTLANDGNPGGGGAVPEPASWALMITGFCMIGLSSRRRRQTKSVTA